jgi:hypothetical protein
MKKKILTIVLACAFALALPGMAFALESANASADHVTTPAWTDKQGNKVELSMTVENADWVKIAESDTDAANRNADGALTGKTIVSEKSYVIEAGDGKTGTVTLVYTTDADNAGLTCYVYVEHSDGTFEQFTKEVDANGNVVVTMDKLSVVTFAVTNETYNQENGSSSDSKTTKAASTDSKSTSPKTGVVA